jgi:diacylglycerol kinase
MKNRIHSFRHAIRGIGMVFKSEKNMQIHLIVSVLVIIAGIFFKINITEWIICLLCFGLVLGAEMVNTSIEKLVDLVSPQRHELAGKAKDIAAGAVLICALIAASVGLIIFIPKAWTFVTTLFA